MKSIIKYLILLFLCFIATIYILINMNNLKYFVRFEDYTPFKNKNYNEVSTNFNKISSELPKIDSAIATYPFSSKLVETIYNKDSYNGELKYVSTQKAYYDIFNNLTDISIVSETNQYQRDILNSLSGDVVAIPFAKEALIFYTNVNNTVDSLTISELNQIYNDKIQRWSEFNFQDYKINAYRLNSNIGGSEECFTKVVKLESPNTNKKIIAKDMKDIVDLVARDNGGIAYAFNLFYTKLYNRKEVKLISINGVSPSMENITSGNYPLMFNVYFIYRKSNSNPNIDKIINWLSTAEGKNFIKENGCMPN